MEEERAREDIVRRDASSLLEATRKRERKMRRLAANF
jgi:hypothetical protein